MTKPKPILPWMLVLALAAGLAAAPAVRAIGILQASDDVRRADPIPTAKLAAGPAQGQRRFKLPTQF